MIAYEASALTAASAEDVWAEWIDVERWAEGGAVESAQIEGPFEVGTVIRTKAIGFPKSNLTITVVDPPRLWVDESKAPGLQMTFEHVIEPDPAGTKLTERVLIRGLLARLVGPLMRSRLEQLLAASTAYLAQRTSARSVQG